MVLFTLLGLYALFRRERNNVNHPGQDENMNQGDDPPPQENIDGQTYQEIPCDLVVLPSEEEPTTSGDPQVDKDQSLEEPTVGNPQIEGDWSPEQSKQEKIIGDPEDNDDWSPEQSIQEPNIGDPEDNDIWNDYQSMDEPVSWSAQVEDDWSVYLSFDEPASWSAQVEDEWSVYLSFDEPASWSSQVEDDGSVYQSMDEPASWSSQVEDDLSVYFSMDEPASWSAQVEDDWCDSHSLDGYYPSGSSGVDDFNENVLYSLPESCPSRQQEDIVGKISKINSHIYKIGNKLGEGGFGSVYEGTRLEDGLQVALKFAFKNSTEYVSIDNFDPAPIEVALHIFANREPKIPQIAQLLDWQDKENYYIMVIERPMPCLSVDTFLNNYTGIIGEDLVRVIMRQTVFAAQECCHRHVFHRDIKKENLIINPETLQVKLIDFGCGDFINKKGYKYFCGTKQFRPPEYKIEGRYFCKPATVWSLGMMMFEMLCGKFPESLDMDLIQRKIWTKDELSPECCNLICSFLQINPRNRIELDNVFLHEWFKTEDLEDDEETILKINSYTYKMGDQLGEGGFGLVYEAVRMEDGAKVAVKYASKENADYTNFDGYSQPIPLEVALHILATKPKIPQIIHILDWEENDNGYIMVLERPMPCLAVDDFLRRYRGPMDQEDLARVIMRQTVIAAQACCQRGVLHRDIKMENLLINTETLEVKLIDFGCGAFLNSEGYKYYSGTQEYCPLEYVIDGKYHGKPATVWSLGILLYVMLCWHFPRSSDLDKIFKFKIVIKNSLSRECCDFIGCCLQLDPEKRINLDDVLLHNWFKMDVENDN